MFTPQWIYKIKKALHGITVRAVRYISKSEFILYISLPRQIASVHNEAYKNVMEKSRKTNHIKQKSKGSQKEKNEQ